MEREIIFWTAKYREGKINVPRNGLNLGFRFEMR